MVDKIRSKNFKKTYLNVDIFEIFTLFIIVVHPRAILLFVSQFLDFLLCQPHAEYGLNIDDNQHLPYCVAPAVESCLTVLEARIRLPSWSPSIAALLAHFKF